MSPAEKNNTDPEANNSPWDFDVIVPALLEAGQLALNSRRNLKRELKPDASIVTEADKNVEDLLTQKFEDLHQSRYIIGEETIDSKPDGYLEDALKSTAYIIDPIDGTAPYAHGMPHWGISMGLLQKGLLTDGAVYLPQMEFGEIVISKGPDVLWGRAPAPDCPLEDWEWDTLNPPQGVLAPDALLCISQDQAKRGRTDLPNPVQVLGTAVYAIVGVMTGRFLAYIGSLKLWDVAGCLPLAERLNLSSETYRGNQPGPLGSEVPGVDKYITDPEHSFYWGVRGGYICTQPDLIETFRKSFSI